jgi:hypothetical protein
LKNFDPFETRMTRNRRKTKRTKAASSAVAAVNAQAFPGKGRGKTTGKIEKRRKKGKATKKS